MEKAPSFLLALMGKKKKDGDEDAPVSEAPDEGKMDIGAIHAAAAFRRAISKGDDEALVKSLRDLMEYC